jgi:hypothetical protein
MNFERVTNQNDLNETGTEDKKDQLNFTINALSKSNSQHSGFNNRNQEVYYSKLVTKLIQTM